MIDHAQFWSRFVMRFVIQPAIVVVIALVASAVFHRPMWGLLQFGLIANITCNLMFTLPDGLDYADFLRYQHRRHKYQASNTQDH